MGVIAILVLGEVRTYKNRDEAMASIRKEGGDVILGEPIAERSPWQFRTWIQPFVEDHPVSAVRLVRYQLRNDEDLRRVLALDEMSDLTLVGELDANLVSQLKRLPILESLALESANVDESVVDGLENHPTLNQLFLSNCTLTPETLSALEVLPINLSLSLEDQSVSDEFLVALTKCKNLRTLRFFGCNIDNERLQLLQGSSTTTQLALNGTKVTTAGLVSLQAVNKGWTVELQSIDAERRDSTPPNRFPSSDSMGTQSRLDFAGPCIDDALFDCIAPAKHLQILSLGNCSITNSGFARIRTFTELKQLYIASKHLMDEDLAAVTELPQLEYLFLNAHSIHGEGLASLPPSIVTLTLRTPQVDSTALNKLSHLNRLQDLTLEGSNFTDQSLQTLPSFPELKQLTLYDTMTTEQGVASLKIRLPGCTITRE